MRLNESMKLMPTLGGAMFLWFLQRRTAPSIEAPQGRGAPGTLGTVPSFGGSLG
jgi:hypothetical protein